MSGEIVDWPRSPIDTGGGNGTGGFGLEKRIAAVETSIGEMRFQIVRIEHKLDFHDIALRRIEEALRSLAEDNKASFKALADLREKVAHIDGRLANIPTFWQTIALMATMLIGIAGLIFTASRLFHP